MLVDLIKWHFGGGKRQFKKEQNELAYMMQHNHDIGILPGGYLLHYSICWCKAPKDKEMIMGDDAYTIECNALKHNQCKGCDCSCH